MSKRKQGELESAIMGCLWDRPEGLSSNQILALLGDDELAITTVLTVLSRLGNKGLLIKQQEAGRKLWFIATKTREAHIASLLLDAVQDSTNPSLVFSHFASLLSSNQLQKLKDVLDK
jgi:predicted transcriptional regulator